MLLPHLLQYQPGNDSHLDTILRVNEHLMFCVKSLRLKVIPHHCLFSVYLYFVSSIYVRLFWHIRDLKNAATGNASEPDMHSNMFVNAYILEMVYMVD